RLGGRQRPDLAGAVAARFARGEAAAAATRLRRSEDPTATMAARPWLAAALVLLGLGVVASTLWQSRRQPDDEPSPTAVHSAQQSESPRPVTTPPVAQEPVKKPAVRDPRLEREPQDPAGELGFELRVVDGHGGPVQDFEMSVLRVAPTAPTIYHRTGDGWTRRLHPRDFPGDFTTIAGLPAGSYAVSVLADAHALTISATFTLTAAVPAPRITVTLNKGGEIRGRVVDGDGRPIKGVTVRSHAPALSNLPRGNSFTRMLEQALAKVHTELTVSTDEDGRFRMKGLAFGTYAVIIEHPDFCAAEIANVAVGVEPNRTDEVKLDRGTIVRGLVVDNDGAPIAGAQVTVQLPSEGANALPARSWQVTADADGAFKLDGRLPAGTYLIHGCQPTGAKQNPFEMLQQMQQSRQEVHIEKAATEVEFRVALKRR
ncbi:MAG: carboxypeptidase regulatory-like domain-containing protein, partial [Planctomycetes bacterium]|nr:carboxypeptidase regulatory-like domain-containing protein [Planctomycetota bacterium]